LDNRRFKTQHALGNEVYQDIDAVFTQDNVNEGDIVLTSNYRPDDAYTAEQDLSAFYINQLVSVTSQLDVFAGLRIESSKQQLIDSQNGSAYEPLETSDALASISANYSLSDAHKLRLGFANTLSRPDFREFSPNRYKDPVTGDIVFGYPDLDYTKINNLDFKYEWYMSYDEMFSIGVFQKDFTNPVETIVNKDTNSQGGAKIITYRNALGATSQGIEVGIRKRLNFMGSFFDNIYASSNYALINSSVQLEANSTDTFIKELTTTDRPMQGQSSYVFNLNLGYDNPNTSRSAFLAYNEYGKRIVALGSFGAPDYYEYPFKKLDFVLNWQLNDTYDVQIKKIGYSFGVKVTNILDSDVEVRQGDAVYETHKPGVGVDVSFSLKY
jgi:TonB-dependent receptor